MWLPYLFPIYSEEWDNFVIDLLALTREKSMLQFKADIDFFYLAISPFYPPIF